MKPVTLGAANYVLIVFSALLGLVLIAGLSLLILKELVRARDAKNMEFRQKLNVRRKGISGISVVRTMSMDDSTVECASYIELSETPTSVRCSSAWTPSPDRVCASETTTSGNFSLWYSETIDQDLSNYLCFMKMDAMSRKSLNIGLLFPEL